MYRQMITKADFGVLPILASITDFIWRSQARPSAIYQTPRKEIALWNLREVVFFIFSTRLGMSTKIRNCVLTLNSLGDKINATYSNFQ